MADNPAALSSFGACRWSTEVGAENNSTTMLMIPSDFVDVEELSASSSPIAPRATSPRPELQARSSSLMPVLARVCASTRLTITAQYRLYLPSADGRLPGDDHGAGRHAAVA